MLEIVFHELFLLVEALVNTLGHFGVFLGMVLESACIPLPSEIILPFSGYMVWLGRLNFPLTVLAGTFGNLAGAYLAYLAGFYGGKPFIQRYGKYFFLSWHEYTRAQDWFCRHGQITIFLSRLLPIIRTYISLPAGVAKMDLKKFLFYTFAGSLPWTCLFVYLGMKLGEHWEDILPLFHRLDYLSAALVLTALFFFVKRKLSRR